MNHIKISFFFKILTLLKSLVSHRVHGSVANVFNCLHSCSSSHVICYKYICLTTYSMKDALRLMTVKESYSQNLKRELNLVALYLILQYSKRTFFFAVQFLCFVLLVYFNTEGLFYLQRNEKIFEDDFQIGSLPGRFARSTTARDIILICCHR